MNEVFDNMYITNVEKRLRELNAPSEIDKKRWVWELIQNAKDTIALDPNRNEINVRIEINGDTVKFRHDGAPFTAKARYGLLYKNLDSDESMICYYHTKYLSFWNIYIPINNRTSFRSFGYAIVQIL